MHAGRINAFLYTLRRSQSFYLQTDAPGDTNKYKVRRAEHIKFLPRANGKIGEERFGHATRFKINATYAVRREVRLHLNQIQVVSGRQVMKQHCLKQLLAA